MAPSIMSLARTASGAEYGTGSVPTSVAKFYEAAEAGADKASVHLARAALDLARCFPATRQDQAWNVSAGHAYGVAHTVKGEPIFTEAGEPILDEDGDPLVPLVKVSRRQFARMVGAGEALVKAGHTAREVPTEAEVAVVRAALGLAYARPAKREARPPQGGDAPKVDAPKVDAPSGKRADEVKAPAGSGTEVPLPSDRRTLSPFDQMIQQIEVWERGIMRDQLRLTDAQREKLLDAITSLGAAMNAQHEREDTRDMGLRANRVKRDAA